MTRVAGTVSPRGGFMWVALGASVAYVLLVTVFAVHAGAPIFDAAQYLGSGRGIADNGLFGRWSGADQRTFGYPLFVSVCVHLARHVPLSLAGVVVVAQSVLFLGAALGMAVVLRRAAGDVVGGAALVLVLLNPVIAAFAAVPLTETLSLALFIGAVALVGLAGLTTGRAIGVGALGGAGLLVGYAVEVRPASVVLVPALVVGVVTVGWGTPAAWRRGNWWPRRGRRWVIAGWRVLSRQRDPPSDTPHGAPSLGPPFAVPPARQLAGTDVRHAAGATSEGHGPGAAVTAAIATTVSLATGPLVQMAINRRLFGRLTPFPVQDLGRLQSAYGTAVLKYATFVSGSTPRVLYQNPLRHAGDATGLAFYLRPAGVLTAVVHMLASLSPDHLVPYVRDLHPWYQVPLEAGTALVVALGVYGAARWLVAARRGEPLPLPLPLGAMVLTAIAGNLALNAVAAVETRFGFVSLVGLSMFGASALPQLRLDTARRRVAVAVGGGAYAVLAVALGAFVGAQMVLAPQALPPLP